VSELQLSGALAPPMLNGEAVFEAPWQGRVFGMAHALADAGVFTWDEFRVLLIAEIADWDRTGAGEYAYYEHFQRALEQVLAGREVVPAAALSERAAALDQRPHGHDHVRHDHHGEHGHPHHDH
jgi:nitrile hydratase accessory protein